MTAIPRAHAGTAGALHLARRALFRAGTCHSASSSRRCRCCCASRASRSATIGFASLLDGAVGAQVLCGRPSSITRWWPRIGRRRSWILAMQLAAVTRADDDRGRAGLRSTRDAHGRMFVLNSIAATQDIATDGLAVELLPAERARSRERPAGRRLSRRHDRRRRRVARHLRPARPSRLVRDHGRAHRALDVARARSCASPRPSRRATARRLARDVTFFGCPARGESSRSSSCTSSARRAAQGMLRPFLVDRGLGLAADRLDDRHGRLRARAWPARSSVARSSAARPAARARRVRHRPGRSACRLRVSRVRHADAIASSSWAGVEHFASGMATAALFTAMMDWSRPSASGTDYTVQASAVVIATGIASTLSGCLGRCARLWPALRAGGGVVCGRCARRVAVVSAHAVSPAQLPHAEVRT